MQQCLGLDCLPRPRSSKIDCFCKQLQALLIAFKLMTAACNFESAPAALNLYY